MPDIPLTAQELQRLRNLGNECEEAADEIERLRAEVERLSQDAARLDWISRNPGFSSCIVVDAPHDGEYVVSVEGDGPRDIIAYGKTFRAAIDAARGEEMKP